MILYAALLFSLVVALMRGGSVRHLAMMRLRCGWLILAVVAPQILIIFLPEGYEDRYWVGCAVMLAVSYCGLAILAWLNHSLSGMKLLALGIVLNGAVILANGGFMPVTPEALARAGHSEVVLELERGLRVVGSKDVVLNRDDTNLWPLSDIFVIPKRFPLAGSFSIGDALIISGCFMLMQSALIQKKETQGRAVPDSPRGHGDG